MSLYGKSIYLRKMFGGTNIVVYLNWACNLSCHYCSSEIPTRKQPKEKPLSMEQLKSELIRLTPIHNIKEVYISGGEPTLVKWLPEFANWLLDEGYHVLIFSNLHDVEQIKKIRKSYRLKIVATYHSSDDARRFALAMFEIDEYQFHLKEIADGTKYKPKFKDAKFYHLTTLDEFKEPALRLIPNGEIYYSHYDILKAKK